MPSTLSPYPGGTVFNNAGGSLFYSGNNYSLDPAPDVVLKVAADPGRGHYELYGLGRWFRSSVAGADETTFGGSVGAALILPVLRAPCSSRRAGCTARASATMARPRCLM